MSVEVDRQGETTVEVRCSETERSAKMTEHRIERVGGKDEKQRVLG